MVQYIYFVKCPDCEDEPFDFFDEAKSYAMGCMSQKPVITQVEVCRNDFGECTESSDLGTVWSWEDMMNDVPNDAMELSTFSKCDTVDCSCCDAEFDSLDNSLDSVPDNFRKPVPESMSIKDLVEEMERNEDDVECTWCNELFDKSECRYEVDLGYLCSSCEAAIKSRGEPLTFRENSYWDFLDEGCAESAKPVKALAEDIELDYHNVPVTIFGAKISGGYWDPPEYEEYETEIDYTYDVDVNSVIEYLQDEITDEEICELAGLSSPSEIPWWEPDMDDSAKANLEAFWDNFWEQHLDYLVTKYEDQLLDHFEDSAFEAAQEWAAENYEYDEYDD